MGPEAPEGLGKRNLAGVLCLLGGILGAAVGLSTGEWPEFLDNERIPGRPLSPTIIVTLFGVAFLILAQQSERGKAWAGAGLTCVSCLGVIIAAVHVAISVSAWFEVVFFLLLTINGLACWAGACERRATK
jgi:hypothetical protein